MGKTCKGCGVDRLQTDYSKNQWRKPRGEGCCLSCSTLLLPAQGLPPSSQPLSSAAEQTVDRTDGSKPARGASCVPTGTLAAESSPSTGSSPSIKAKAPSSGDSDDLLGRPRAGSVPVRKRRNTAQSRIDAFKQAAGKAPFKGGVDSSGAGGRRASFAAEEGQRVVRKGSVKDLARMFRGNSVADTGESIDQRRQNNYMQRTRRTASMSAVPDGVKAIRHGAAAYDRDSVVAARRSSISSTRAATRAPPASATENEGTGTCDTMVEGTTVATTAAQGQVGLNANTVEVSRRASPTRTAAATQRQQLSSCDVENTSLELVGDITGVLEAMAGSSDGDAAKFVPQQVHNDTVLAGENGAEVVGEVVRGTEKKNGDEYCTTVLRVEEQVNAAVHSVADTVATEFVRSIVVAAATATAAAEVVAAAERAEPRAERRHFADVAANEMVGARQDAAETLQRFCRLRIAARLRRDQRKQQAVKANDGRSSTVRCGALTLQNMKTGVVEKARIASDGKMWVLPMQRGADKAQYVEEHKFTLHDVVHGGFERIQPNPSTGHLVLASSVVLGEQAGLLGGALGVTQGGAPLEGQESKGKGGGSRSSSDRPVFAVKVEPHGSLEFFTVDEGVPLPATAHQGLQVGAAPLALSSSSSSSSSHVAHPCSEGWGAASSGSVLRLMRPEEAAQSGLTPVYFSDSESDGEESEGSDRTDSDEEAERSSMMKEEGFFVAFGAGRTAPPLSPEVVHATYLEAQGSNERLHRKLSQSSVERRGSGLAVGGGGGGDDGGDTDVSVAGAEGGVPLNLGDRLASAGGAGVAGRAERAGGGWGGYHRDSGDSGGDSDVVVGDAKEYDGI